MRDLGQKIGLPKFSLIAINLNLIAALKDCPNGKAIEIEKKESTSDERH